MLDDIIMVFGPEIPTHEFFAMDDGIWPQRKLIMYHRHQSHSTHHQRTHKPPKWTTATLFISILSQILSIGLLHILMMVRLGSYFVQKWENYEVKVAVGNPQLVKIRQRVSVNTNWIQRYFPLFLSQFLEAFDDFWKWNTQPFTTHMIMHYILDRYLPMYIFQNAC